MAMKESSDFKENKLATIVGHVFYMDLKILDQSDAKKIGKNVKMLVVEAD